MKLEHIIMLILILLAFAFYFYPEETKDKIDTTIDKGKGIIESRNITMPDLLNNTNETNSN